MSKGDAKEAWHRMDKDKSGGVSKKVRVRVRVRARSARVGTGLGHKDRVSGGIDDISAIGTQRIV